MNEIGQTGEKLLSFASNLIECREDDNDNKLIPIWLGYLAKRTFKLGGRLVCNNSFANKLDGVLSVLNIFTPVVKN